MSAETVNRFTSWFGSPYYHMLYNKRDNEEAGQLLNKIIGLIKPAPGAKMLNVNCGNGADSKILASFGFDVTGIDLIQENIEQAKQLENEGLHFFTHDMRLPFWINYFDLAVNLFTRFGFFHTERENGNALRTMANSVKPGCNIVIDYLNTHYAEDNLQPRSEEMIGRVNFQITKWFDETHFYRKIIVEDESRDEPLEFREKIAKFSLGDFNEMLALHHIQVNEVFGDYQLNPYHLHKSPRLLILGSKRIPQ